jgi:hypothetical protein
MGTATFVPDLALGFAQMMNDVFEKCKVEELTASEVSDAIFFGRVVRDVLAKARQSIEASLCAGVDAHAFAAKYERTVTDLDALLTTVEQVVAKARTSRLPAPAEELVSSYQDLGGVSFRLLF